MKRLLFLLPLLIALPSYAQLNCSGGTFGCPAPTIYGGTAAGSGITFKTTTGVGSGDAFTFTGGTNGATTFGILKAAEFDIYGTATKFIRLYHDGTNPIVSSSTNGGELTLETLGNGDIFFRENGATRWSMGFSADNYALFPGDDNTQPFGKINLRLSNAYIIGLHSGASAMTFATSGGDVTALTLNTDQTAVFAKGMTVNSATATGTTNTSGTFYAVGLTAEPGTKSAMCHDDVTMQVETNPAATCTVSNLEQKAWVEDVSCSEARRIVSQMRPAIFKDKDGGDGPRFGFAAEWTVPVDRRLVYYDGKGKPHGIDYERYDAVLTKYLQCQPMAESRGWLRRLF